MDDNFKHEADGILEETRDVEVKQSEGRGGSGIKSVFLFIAAAVLIFFFVNNQIFARTPGINGLNYGRGNCCNIGGDQVSEEEMTLAALQYYRSNIGDEDVDAAVEDFGCHQEILISLNGEVIRRFSYYDGKIYDLTR